MSVYIIYIKHISIYQYQFVFVFLCALSVCVKWYIISRRESNTKKTPNQTKSNKIKTSYLKEERMPLGGQEEKEGFLLPLNLSYILNFLSKTYITYFLKALNADI